MWAVRATALSRGEPGFAVQDVGFGGTGEDRDRGHVERTVAGDDDPLRGEELAWRPERLGSIMSPFGFNPMCSTWPRKKAARVASSPTWARMFSAWSRKD